jgi:hypothetical protein
VFDNNLDTLSEKEQAIITTETGRCFKLQQDYQPTFIAGMATFIMPRAEN